MRLTIFLIFVQLALAKSWWVFAAVLFPCGLAYADDSLLRRSLTAYSEYEQVSITGTATRYVGDTVAEAITFTANFGRGVNGAPPPYEIGHRIPNPGEPHLDDKDIFLEAVAEVDGITVHFKRRLVTTPPVSERRSAVILSKVAGHVPPFQLIRRAILADLMASEPRENSGHVSQALELCNLETLGKEEVFGLDAVKVRLIRSMKDTPKPDTPPLVIESLVSTDPTFQVLSHLSVSGGLPGWLDRDGNRDIFLSRKVESARVINNWLVCDKVRFPTYDGSWLVEIDDIRPLPANYDGLWSFNSLTGVDFTGPLESGTRRGSPRLELKHTKNATFIPYTQAEQEKIRQFLISQTLPIERKIAWSRVLFWSVNAAAIMVLCYVGYRRYRFG